MNLRGLRLLLPFCGLRSLLSAVMPLFLFFPMLGFAQTGTITPGVPLSVTIDTSGQQAMYSFSGAAGQLASVQLSNVTFPLNCYNAPLMVSILNPDGSTLSSVNMSCGSLYLSPVTLPTTGTYTLVINPTTGGTGSATVALFVFANQTATITPGVPISLTISTPGQQAIYSFSGMAGQQASVQLSNVTFPLNCYNAPLMVSILNPDGSTLSSVNMSCGSLYLSPVTLPTTGIYTLVINPTTGGTGSASILLWITDAQTAPPTITPSPGTYNAPQTISLGAVTPGSTIYYTIDGTIPTISSPVYSAPFAVAFTQTVQAIAVASPFLASAVTGGAYSIVETPQINALSPASGVVGVTVAINGTGFGQSQGSSTVTLNGQTLTPLAWSPTGVVIKIPQGANSGNVIVTAGGLVSNSALFTVVDPTTGFNRSITINHSMVPNSDQANFPVLISGTYNFLTSETSGGRVLTSDGSDIMFTSDSAGRDLLDFELDSYNPVSGQAAFWVRIPTLSHTTDTTIYIWYGIPGLTQSQQNPTGVWQSNYASVWHFANATGLSVNDSTVNGNIGAINGATATTGEIGVAANFNGNSQILIPTGPSLSFGAGDFAVSAWAQTSASSGESVIATGDQCGIAESWLLETHNNSASFSTFGTGGAQYLSSPSAMNDGNWHYLTGVRSGTNVFIYQDGVLVNSSTVSASYDSDTAASQLAIGNAAPGGSCGGLNWNGSIDELHISSVARSSDWIATEYNDQSSPATFYSIGQEYSVSGPLPTINSVTPNPALAGQWITVSGIGFGGAQGSGTLTINGTGVAPSSWTDTSITFALPANVSSGPLVVTNGTAASQGIPFTNNGQSVPTALIGPECPALQSNEYVAWATPTNVNFPDQTCPVDPFTKQSECTNGSVNATTKSSSITMTSANPLGGQSWIWGATWTGFQVPSIPPNATIQGIYAAAQFSASGQGADEIGTVDAFDGVNPIDLDYKKFYWSDDTNQIGGCSANLLAPVGSMTVDQISSSSIGLALGQTALSTFSKSISSGPVGFAIYYTLPTAPAASAVLLNPYLLPSISEGGSTIAESDLEYASNPQTNTAATTQQIVADGTSTAVVAYRTNIKEDVTFSVQSASGATLAEYFPAFLTYGPTPCSMTGAMTGTGGCIELPVSASALVQGGDGAYYAYALFQAPLAASSDTFNTTDTIVATQRDAPAQTMTLSYVPKPVLLIHGLWGDKTSFESVANYLTSKAPYNQFPWSINPICYSKYLAWDAASDPLESPDLQCETTSTLSIVNELTAIYNQLDGNDIVGGRVDVIAHSMGGLATRHFATEWSVYGSIRDRYLGPISQAYFLDTPELGSALANFLVSQAGDTLTAPPDPDENGNPQNPAYILWTFAGCNPSPQGSGDPPPDTLQSCFAKMSLPLTLPGLDSSTGAPYDPNGGAVGSLQTNYAGLDALNSSPAGIPGIPDLAGGGAISSTFSLSGGTGSVLRTVLNTFIDAVQWGNGNTVDAIFGSTNDQWVPNDVIVTLASQLAGTSDGAPYCYTAHTGITNGAPFNMELPLQLLGLSDNNVMSASGVNSMLYCSLFSPGVACGQSTSCNPTVAPDIARMDQSPEQTVVPRIGRWGGVSSPDASWQDTTEVAEMGASARPQSAGWPQRMFLANNRVDVVIPSGASVLGKEVRVQLRVHADGLSQIETSQVQYYGNDRGRPDIVYGSRAQAHLSSDRDDNSVYIGVVPLRLGVVEVHIDGRFSDGGLVHKSVTLNVIAPAEPPRKLIVAQAGVPDRNAAVIVIYQKPSGLRNGLTTYAVYDGIAAPVKIDPSLVSYRLSTGDSTESVRLDRATGALIPLHDGQTLIESSFGGIKQLTCVVVKASLQIGGSYSTACQNLLVPGEKLGPQ